MLLAQDVASTDSKLTFDEFLRLALESNGLFVLAGAIIAGSVAIVVAILTSKGNRRRELNNWRRDELLKLYLKLLRGFNKIDDIITQISIIDVESGTEKDRLENQLRRYKLALKGSNQVLRLTESQNELLILSSKSSQISMVKYIRHVANALKAISELSKTQKNSSVEIENAQNWLAQENALCLLLIQSELNIKESFTRRYKMNRLGNQAEESRREFQKKHSLTIEAPAGSEEERNPELKSDIIQKNKI